MCVLCSGDEYYVDLCGSIPDLTAAGEQSISQFICVHTCTCTLLVYAFKVKELHVSSLVPRLPYVKIARGSL